MQKFLILGSLALLGCVSPRVLGAVELPPDSEYVVAHDDGDLYVGEQAVRFWGGIGGVPVSKAPGEDPYAYARRMADRIQLYGFNMMRVWGQNDAVFAQPEGYTKGDGSRLDLYDAMIAILKERGIRLWFAGAGSGGTATADDVAVIDDPASAEGWSAAITDMAKAQRKSGEISVNLAGCVASAWDPRLEELTIQRTAHFLDHLNQHTGLRRADDPVYAIWELTNEQWWIVQMVSGKWQKLPKFFRDSLIGKWHEFLQNKYGGQEALVAAWGGLKPGEDLAAGTLYLAPLRGAGSPAILNDANPIAQAKVDGEAQTFSRDDFSVNRGRDVNEFFAGLILGHKQRVSAAFKKNGKSAKLSSLVWDTGIGYNGISQLLHQNADAVTHCAYIGGWTNDQSNRRYPWYSGLEEYPRICQNVPWLEHNTVAGKPFFVYECQIGAPSKYRVEFPYRMVFLAAIQGWDAVCWHTMSGGYKWNSEDPFSGMLSAPGHAAAQFNYPQDETQLAAMHVAGQIFANRHLSPAPNPTTFIYGRKSLFHPDSMDYAGSYGKMGEDMLPTAYRYGSRIRIDLNRDDDAIEGPIVQLRGYAQPNPLRPTPQMTYDYQKGYLTMDAPGCAAFTGFLSGYGSDRVTFANGLTISDVRIVSPPDMTYPVTQDEGYVAIGITSTDGKDLATCSRAVFSAVSTSCNTGLQVGPDPEAPERPRHPWESMKVIDRGSLPVQHSRVGCTITSPALVGMEVEMHNWQGEVIGQQTIGADGQFHIEAGTPLFVAYLTR